MCSESEGVSVWFACKLCKSFFLNADDFAYHKKKSHVQEFRSTKFIVFEEQTTPAASPPENWVSFLTPKEETVIHRIISTTLSSTTATTSTNVDYDTRNEGVQSTRNEEFIDIDLETNKVFILNDYDEGRAVEDVGEVTYLNYVFHSSASNDKAIEKRINDPATAQANIGIASRTDYDLSDEERDKDFTRIIEPTTLKNKSSISLKRRIKKKSEKASSNDKNDLQAVIPPPNNPHIHLKRLKLASSVDYEEITPKIEAEPEVFWTSNDGQSRSGSSATNLSLSENLRLDDVCISHNNFNPYFDDDAITNSSTNTNNNIVSEEQPINQAPDINSKGNAPRDPLSLESIVLPSLTTLKATTSNAVLFKCKICCKKIKSSIFQNHVKACGRNHHPSQNDLILNLLSKEDNYSCGDMLHVLKTEYTDKNEESEFPGIAVDHDPLEFDHGVSADDDDTRFIQKKMIFERTETESTKRLETFVCGLEKSCADYFWTRKKDWACHVVSHFPRLKCTSATCGFVERFSLANYTHVSLHDYNGPWSAPSMVSCPYCPYKESYRQGLAHMMETHRAELCNRGSRELPLQKYKLPTSGVRKSRTPKGEHVYRILPGRSLEETVQELGLK